MPDLQRGGGKFRSLISALPYNLEILGSPHCFVRNGMGLPITDSGVNNGMVDFSYKKRS